MSHESEAPMSRLKECFSELEDPRVNRRKKHPLLSIVIMALCSVICGGKSWQAMEDFAAGYEEWLKTFLDLPHGTPSKDTFRRVFMILDPQAFFECFSSFMRLASQTLEGSIVAIDGKALRRSFDTAKEISPLHMLTAWAVENQVVLGQVPIAKKKNEISELPQLLKLLHLEKTIVTADALHCQGSTTEQILEKKAHYVLNVKRNQPTLYDLVVSRFQRLEEYGYDGEKHEKHEETNKGHGRIEIRRYCQVAVNWREMSEKWKGLQTIGYVEAHRITGEKTSVERRYFISSLSLNVLTFSRAVRGHWNIENGQHYILDVLFDEDQCRVRDRVAASNFAALRRMALSLLKKAPNPWEKGKRVFSMTAKGLIASWKPGTYLSKILLTPNAV